MSQSILLSPAEHKVIRVFALSGAPGDLESLDDAARRAWLGDMLGGVTLGPEAVLTAIRDLEDLGLIGYLTEGQGILATDLAGDSAKLSALEGWVAVVPSAAFPADATALNLGAQITLIGTYREEGVDWTAAPMESAAAAPHTSPVKGRPPMSDARISGMVAMGVLIFLAIFVVIFVMLAG